MFDDKGFKEETIEHLTEKVIEFLFHEDGMRCKEDNLTFPHKRDKKGVMRYMMGFRVPEKVEENMLNILTDCDPRPSTGSGSGCSRMD